jgi:hypothetical protein
MKESEVGELLVLSAVIHPRVWTTQEVQLWHRLIGHLDRDDARQAMMVHLQESPFPPKPADITGRVRTARARQQERTGIHPAPPAGKRWAVEIIEADDMKELGQ